MRPFTGGHTWFNQNVQQMEGHSLPQFDPITVHFTFQFGDTGSYPHGKRQRAREASLWAVDPPAYFDEGIFVALDGPTYDMSKQEAVYKRFPSWSPQRHMHMDSPQRQAVRDLLGLATAIGEAIVVLPTLYCHCDRYWGFLKNCRFPMAQNMTLPFACPQDALYDPTRWAKKSVRWREHTFLDNPNVPKSLRDNTVTVRVAAAGEEVQRNSVASVVHLPFGTPMSEVRRHVLQANPAVRVINIANRDLRRLCRWLGSSQRNREFNLLIKYILTESSRYCPQEDHGKYDRLYAGQWDWQNPFTAYNFTWGFHHPTLYPEDDDTCATHFGVELVERPNSTTCPRQMLCDWNTLENGRDNGRHITWCNIEGYNGLKDVYQSSAKHMLSQMPDGRCPYPPGDRPDMPGLDRNGHYCGESCA